MSTTTNINDPAGIAALLEQLKASTAWQELELSTTTADHREILSTQETSSTSLLGSAPSESILTEGAAPSPTGESVASLLSQLKPLSAQVGSAASSIKSRPNPSVANEEDRRKVSFRDSLPILSDLATDDQFALAVKQMKKDQDILERNLFADREAIYTKYQEKFKIVKTKAQMIGTIVSQHDADMMTTGFKNELQQFDSERVIPAWDNLVSRQQQELERLRVPAMYMTGVREDRDCQQQVIRVLEAVVGTKAG